MGGAPSKWIMSLIACSRTDKPRTVRVREKRAAGRGKAWKLCRSFSGVKGSETEQLNAPSACSSANGPFSGAMAAVVRAPLKDFRALQREWAAARIQAVFRSFLARKAYRALRAIVKIQAIFRGQQVRKQAAITLGCMEALVRAQSRARALQERGRNGEQKSKKPWEMRVMKQQRSFKEDGCAKACEDYGKTRHGACEARKNNVNTRISTGQLSSNSSGGSPPTPTSEFYYPESSSSASVFTSSSVSGPPPASSEGRTSVSYIGSPSYMNMTQSAKARQKTRFNRSQRNSMDEFQFFKKHGFAFGELRAAGSDHLLNKG